MEKSDLDCIIQTVTVSRELETLRRKIDDKKILNNVHLQSFRKYCCHKDALIAKLGCDVVIKLVVQKKLSITEAITWFISSLQSSENMNVMIMTIRDILLLNLNQENENLHSGPFGLVSPQHPFILILKEDNTHWPAIEYHIQYMFNTGNSKTVFQSLSSFFKYILWSPPGNVDNGCKRSIWKLLVHHFTSDFSNFVTNTICWLRTDEDNLVLNANFYLTDLPNLEINVEPDQRANFICILAIEIACKAAKLGQDPSFAVVYAKRMLSKYPETTDLVLISIAEFLPSCPISFIADFLHTCIEVINTNGVGDMIVVWTIIGAILPWIIHSTTISEGIVTLANSLLDIVDGKKIVPLRKTSLERLQHDTWFIECVASYTESYWALVIIRAIQTFSLEDLVEQLSSFVVTFDVVQENIIVNMIITAAFLSSDDLHIQQKAFDTLVNTNPGFQFPLILFKLSRTPHVELQMKLLHSLPLTAVVKENIPPIIAMIRSLSSSGKPVLVQLSYSLYSTLWKTEERCYQFLSDEITNRKKEWDGFHNGYHSDIVIASVIRDICTLKPDIHGKEWVKELADIMSLYPKGCDCLPLTIALEAVIKMCKTRTIDVFSVYEEFKKKQLLVDGRTEVIIQLCDLIGFMFQVAAESMVDSQDPLTVIWRILAQSSEKKVIEAALSALSKYNFEEMPLRIIPDQYKKNLKLPRKYSKKKEVTKDEEEFLSFIPGLFWIEYLQNAPEEVKPKICGLLTIWLAQEVKNFSRSIFHSVHRERDSVLSFHEKSIFKATVNHCKYAAKQLEPGNIEKADVKMLIYCLQILNGQPAKSLPPFNWSFLSDFLQYKDDELRFEVLRFWAKESTSSASAKNHMESWLKKIDNCSCDMKELSIALEIVCTRCIGVASETVSSFLSATMQHVLVKCGIEEYESNLYRSTCLCLREALKQPEIDEHNCEAICKNLVTWWENAAVLSECFDDLIDTVKEMPSTYVDYLSSLCLSEHVSTENLYKLLKLRCSLALNDAKNPFLWLNDCIEATTRRLQDRILFFERTLDVFKKHRFSSWKWTWLLQFLDRIQVSADIVSDEICDLKCDIFIFCVVNTSSYHPFLRDPTSVEECYEYFPQALRNTMTEDVSSQVIEWLSHSCKLKKVSDKHKQLFTRGIIASRRNKYLQKLSTWSNVVQKLPM